MKHYYRLVAGVNLICLLILFSSSLQSQKLVYAKAISNTFPVGGNVYPTSTSIDASGNTYMLGFFESTADFDPGPGKADIKSAGLYDMFIAKYNPAGKYVFAKRIGRSGNNIGAAMAIDGSGNMYITGVESDTVDFDPGPAVHNLIPRGGTDMFMAKYDSNGNFIFLKSLAGAVKPTTMTVDAFANLYIAGDFYNTIDFDSGPDVAKLEAPDSRKYSDAFFAKYDANGNYIFAHAITGSGYQSIAGLAIDDSANVYINGNFSGLTNFGPGTGEISNPPEDVDIFFAKYNAAAELEFVKALHNDRQSSCFSITLDDAGFFYITGNFLGSMDFDPGPGKALPAANHLNLTFFIAKYDVSGNYQSVKTLLGEGYVGGRISLEAPGYITLYGWFNGTVDFDASNNATAEKSARESDTFIARYDTAMNLIYIKTMGGASWDYLFVLGYDRSGNMHVAGNFQGLSDFDPGNDAVNLNTITDNNNVFIGAYKSDGSFISAGQIGSYGNYHYSEASKNIAVDRKGNAYITGSYSGGVDFDPGPGLAELISVGNDDAFVAKYDRNGNYVWAISFGSNSVESGKSIAVDDFGNVYVMGSFSKTVDFDPGPGVAIRNSKGYDDTFFVKYDSNGRYIYAKSIGGKWDEFIHDMKVDNAGNLYLAGVINTIHDADPDAGVFEVGTKDEVCFFFSKYDPIGKLVYAKTFGSGSTGDPLGLAVDHNGYVYLTGYFQETVDFDPGPNTANLVSQGKNCVFIASYDAAGIYRFAKAMDSKSSISSNYFHAGHCIAVDDIGNIYITGDISSTTDFDPGPGVANVICNKQMTMFFAKYDATGKYLYAKGIEGDGYNSPTSLAITRSGDTYISGHFYNTVDLDPGPGKAMYTSAGNRDYFMAKYNAMGGYVYAKVIASSYSENRCYVASDEAGSVYLTGTLNDMTGLDSTDTTTKLSTSSIFIAKYTDILKPGAVPFSVKYNEAKREAIIKWSIPSQSDIISFEVTRSLDSFHFEAINKRSGCLQCATGTSYEYHDSKPYYGKSFYRLQMTDDKNQVFYSEALAINVKELLSSTLYVFPVFTNDAFQVFINNRNLKRQVVVQVISAYGLTISEQTVWLIEGDNKFNYSLANKRSGLYYIRVAGKEGETLAPIWVIKK